MQLTGLPLGIVSACLYTAALAAIIPERQLVNFSKNEARSLLGKRENCGPGIGACGGGLCCSQYNWCGNTDEYCGQGCQPAYGACSGTGGGGGGTLNTPRPKFGSVPYGQVITACSTPGTIAITFDDGPYIYTSQLLDLLAQYGVKSTFFINGHNYVDTSAAPYPDILRRMVNDGHQIASHTDTHADLDATDTNGRRQEMANLEAIVANIFGFFPTYMRPPYGNCGGACQSDLSALGYHIITWNIDTDDYDNDSQGAIVNAMNNFDNAVSGDAAHNAYISLEHDVHQWTVQALAAHIIQTAHNRGYRTVTVAECLGDSSGNWYRDATTGNAVGGGGAGASPNGHCGSNNGGYTCAGTSFGRCCSQFGYCGTSDLFCGSGCQSGYGSCGITPTQDGTCSANSGGRYSCTGSSFGRCCSYWGYCGGNDLFCGLGCQSDWGACN
ncbi:glycoside hydrolase/deacetylase [Thozetella sp. PMI_491]|nr:glycoside hydrolase/deacetylase [Thozetella sp. PMI_491]